MSKHKAAGRKGNEGAAEQPPAGVSAPCPWSRTGKEKPAVELLPWTRPPCKEEMKEAVSSRVVLCSWSFRRMISKQVTDT